MKRLLILSALAILATTSAGCCHHNLQTSALRLPLFGGGCSTCGDAPVYDTYGTPVYEAPTYAPAPAPQ